MMTTVPDTRPPDTLPRGLCTSAVCGVDLSAASLDAACQAARLVGMDGSLLLVAVPVGEPTAFVAPGGIGATVVRTPVDDTIRGRYRTALLDAARDVQRAVPRTRTSVLDGDPVACLLDAIDAEGPSLVAVGSHDYHRLSGIVLSSVATHLLHRAPCSVLLARRREPDHDGRILVGIDGSAESLRALDVATTLAARLNRRLVTLVAYGGKPVHDRNTVKLLHPKIETFDAPVHALASAADPSDIVVVGSRGLHGIRALGSVSERIAHRAPCSVLVVRDWNP
ncbi:MAG TPA: universal stress protein, partial [Gaiellaceae bacterium]|nr:universal stress protein [Gaiellaceae bacterium]